VPSLSLLDLGSRRMAKGWIKSATAGAHGQFRKKAEAAGESTAAFARGHDSDKGKTGAQARLAENLMGLGKKSRREKLYDHRKG
jgi:hypothetical protein